MKAGMRFIYVGDLHIKGTNPRSRTDDYKLALAAKIREVNQLAEELGALNILCGGDIFDKPEVSTGVLLEFAEIFAESKVAWYTTPGNHDLYSYNISTYRRTSLALLEMIVPQFHVIKSPEDFLTFHENGVQTAVTFTPFTSAIDRNGYGYSPVIEQDPRIFQLHIAHGMLLDHVPPFERYSLVQEVETTADLVVTAHDHIGYGVYERADGKTFVNPGALPRLSASVGEMERTVQVLQIDIFEDKQFDLQLIPLKSAKPGTDVLDRSKIEASQKRQYAMETFSALIQAKTGDVVLLDIDSIVEQMGDLEGFDREIIKLAIDKIEEAKIKL